MTDTSGEYVPLTERASGVVCPACFGRWGASACTNCSPPDPSESVGPSPSFPHECTADVHGICPDCGSPDMDRIRELLSARGRENCGGCRFFDLVVSFDDDHQPPSEGIPEAICRRFPPTDGAWSNVLADDWCGEFQAEHSGGPSKQDGGS